MANLEQDFESVSAKRGETSWDGVRKSDLYETLKMCGIAVFNKSADADPVVVNRLHQDFKAGYLTIPDLYLQVARMRDDKVPPGPFNLDPLVKGSNWWTVMKNEAEFRRDGKDVKVVCDRGVAVLKGNEMVGAPKVKIIQALLCAEIATYTTITNNKAVIHYERDMGSLNKRYDQSASAHYWLAKLEMIMARHPFEGSISGMELAERMYNIYSGISLVTVVKQYSEGTIYEPDPVKERSNWCDVKLKNRHGADETVSARVNVKVPPVPDIVYQYNGNGQDDMLCQAFCGQMAKSTGGVKGLRILSTMFVDGVPLSPSARTSVDLWTFIKNIDFAKNRNVIVDIPSNDMVLWLWKQANMLHPKITEPLIFYKSGKMSSTLDYITKIKKEGGVIIVSSFDDIDCLKVDIDMIEVSNTGVLSTIRTAVCDQIETRWWLKKKFITRVPVIGLAKLEEKMAGKKLFYGLCVESWLGYVVVSNVPLANETMALESLMVHCKYLSYVRHRYHYFHACWEVMIARDKRGIFRSLVVGKLWNFTAEDNTELLDGDDGIYLSADLVLSAEDMTNELIKRGEKEIITPAIVKGIQLVNEGVKGPQGLKQVKKKSKKLDVPVEVNEDKVDMQNMFGGDTT